MLNGRFRRMSGWFCRSRNFVPGAISWMLTDDCVSDPAPVKRPWRSPRGTSTVHVPDDAQRRILHRCRRIVQVVVVGAVARVARVALERPADLQLPTGSV